SLGPGPDWEVHRHVSSRRNGDRLGLCHVAAVLRPARTNLIGVLAGTERGRLKLTDGPRRRRSRTVKPELGVGRHAHRDVGHGVGLSRIPAGIRGYYPSVGVEVPQMGGRAIPEVIGRVVAVGRVVPVGRVVIRVEARTEEETGEATVVEVAVEAIGVEATGVETT